MRHASFFAFRCVLFAFLAAASLDVDAQPALSAGKPIRIEASLVVQQDRQALENPSREHVVTIPEGMRVSAGVTSTEIDPVLEVVDQATGEVIAFDDDGGGGLNSLAAFPVHKTGSYLFRVSNLGSGGGSYTLLIETLPPLPDALPIGAPSLRMNFSVQDGELTTNDARSGAYFDDYRLPLREGDEVLVRLQSFDFSPSAAILHFRNRDGAEIAFSDDMSGGPGAILLFRAPAEDEYVIRVTSLMAPQTGRYRLWVGRAAR